MTSDEQLNVLDWAQFLRDRRRAAEKNGKGKISVLAAARARFNLVANFVISEIILTHPHDRTVVVSKFIRIAWVRTFSCLLMVRFTDVCRAEGLYSEQLLHPCCYYHRFVQ